MYELLPYQQRFLLSRAPRKLWVKARRVGGSWAAAFGVAMSANGFELQESGRLTYNSKRAIPWRIISVGQKNARDLLEDIRQHVKQLSEWSGKKLIRDDLVEEIKLSNGLRIEALAANPGRSRGGKGGLLLDEFANMPFAEDIYQAAVPSTNQHIGRSEPYPLWIISTPLSSESKFGNLVLTPEGDSFEKHHTSIHEAMDEGFVADLDVLRSDMPDESRFAVEYECQFFGSDSRVVSDAVYDACLYGHQQLPSKAAMSAWGGYDVARKAKGDMAALVELASYEQGRDVVAWVPPGGCVTRRGVSFDDQEAWVGKALEDRLDRVAIDATGMGMPIAERLTRRYGDTRVLSVDFASSTVRDDVVAAFGDRFHRRLIRVPADDVDLRRGVLSIARGFTRQGRETYSAPRSKGSGHADAGWALAMACYAARSGAHRSLGIKTHNVHGVRWRESRKHY